MKSPDPMADYQQIYDQQADRYDALVAKEDHRGELSRALDGLLPGTPLDVVETGAGTGRLTKLLAPRARRVRAFDAAAAMIERARHHLRDAPHVSFDVALHDALPVEPGSADVGIEGWAFGHAVGWNPTGWRDDVRRFVDTLARALQPAGRVVLLETMGTGVERPFEGGHSLEPFHHFVTTQLGFEHRVLRTDYGFSSVDEAVETLGFFFGERLTSKIRERGWSIVPECTGLYWRRAG